LDNAIWYNSYNDTSRVWSGWVFLGGYATGSPVLVASSSANRLDLLVQGGANVVWHKSYVNGVWSSTWDTPDGTSPSTPAAVSDGSTLHLVIRGSDNGIYYNSLAFNTGSWSGWKSLFGSTMLAPSLAIDSSGTVHLVVVGLNGFVYHMSKPAGGPWSGTWDSPGGSTGLAPAVVVNGSSIEIVVEGTDGRLYSNTLQGSSWQGWNGMGGTTNNPPAISIV
jgi:hypothetical protein